MHNKSKNNVILLKQMLENNYSVKYLTIEEALKICHLGLKSKIAYKEECFDIDYLQFIAKLSKSKSYNSQDPEDYDYVIAYINPQNNILLTTIVGFNLDLVNMIKNREK